MFFAINSYIEREKKNNERFAEASPELFSIRGRFHF